MSLDPVEALRHAALFADFGYGELASLARELETVIVPAGHTVFAQGDAVRGDGPGVVVVAEGRARLLAHRSDGSVGVDQVIDPVQAIGLVALLRAPGRRTATLQATTACTLLQLSAARWHQLVAGHDDLAFRLQLLSARQLAQDLRRTEAALREGLVSASAAAPAPASTASAGPRDG